jgi:hypothetical protein
MGAKMGKGRSARESPEFSRFDQKRRARVCATNLIGLGVVRGAAVELSTIAKSMDIPPSETTP